MFIPDGAPCEEALRRCTHLGIVAHPDDLEFMAFPGVLACRGRKDAWFGGIVCTDGAGSARSGEFAARTDPEMVAIRAEEQRSAARLGEYSFVAQLGFSSQALKAGSVVAADALREVLLACRPQEVFTHNPFDKHPTHVAVFRSAVEVLRALPDDAKPNRVFGCELWRGLDWIPDARKVLLDVSGGEPFAAELAACFPSQIAGGKRYDLALEGRWRANATFLDPHALDVGTSVAYAVDLNPLIRNPKCSVGDFVREFLDDFQRELSSE